MGDERLRELERRFLSTGAADDKEAYETERIRMAQGDYAEYIDQKVALILDGRAISSDTTNASFAIKIEGILRKETTDYLHLESTITHHRPLTRTQGGRTYQQFGKSMWKKEYVIGIIQDVVPEKTEDSNSP